MSAVEILNATIDTLTRKLADSVAECAKLREYVQRHETTSCDKFMREERDFWHKNFNESKLAANDLIAKLEAECARLREEIASYEKYLDTLEATQHASLVVRLDAAIAERDELQGKLKEKHIECEKLKNCRDDRTEAIFNERKAWAERDAALAKAQAMQEALEFYRDQHDSVCEIGYGGNECTCGAPDLAVSTLAKWRGK